MRAVRTDSRSSDISSYSGFMKWRPVESSLTSPKMTTDRCGLRMSVRNAWFIQVQRIAPLVSPTTAWKILKPRRLVTARWALLISPSTAARIPGRRDAIGCM